MKLTNEQLKQAVEQVVKEQREAVGVIIRMGGDKEDYQQLLVALNHHFVDMEE